MPTGVGVGLLLHYFKRCFTCNIFPLYDTNSKMQARQSTRNEQGYNSHLGWTGVRLIKIGACTCTSKYVYRMCIVCASRERDRRPGYVRRTTLVVYPYDVRTSERSSLALIMNSSKKSRFTNHASAAPRHRQARRSVSPVACVRRRPSACFRWHRASVQSGGDARDAERRPWWAQTWHRQTIECTDQAAV